MFLRNRKFQDIAKNNIYNTSQHSPRFYRRVRCVKNKK